MLCVIEGADGTGKTTLVNRLKRLSPVPVTVLHKGPPDPERHILEEYGKDLDWYRPTLDRLLVLDRWHLGEMIYGPLLRGVSKLDPPMRLWIDMYLASRGAILVNTIQSPPVVRDRIAKRGDGLIKPEMVEEILARYEEIVSTPYIPCMKALDLEDYGASKVIEMAATCAQNTLSLADHPRYVGCVAPTILLVGDVRGGDQSWAGAFPPLPNSSGHYLMETISNWPPLNLAHIGLTNANDSDVVGILEAVHTRPPVVALGMEAAHTLEELHVEHGTVYHPQYRRRFMYDDQAEYANEILAAASDVYMSRREAKAPWN